jgi:hypothetical protein
MERNPQFHGWVPLAYSTNRPLESSKVRSNSAKSLQEQVRRILSSV